MKAKKGDKVVLIKISDDKFNGNHPNGIIEGYTRIGKLINDVVIGDQVLVINNTHYLCTSEVTEIIDDITFKTENSTYKIEVLNENDSK